MTRSIIIDHFLAYRQKISAWFDDKRKEVDPQSVTYQHFEQGFKDGYEQRIKDEHEELMDAL